MHFGHFEDVLKENFRSLAPEHLELLGKFVHNQGVERFAQLAAASLSQALGRTVQTQELETPPDPKMGDFGYPCFKLSKEFRKAPPAVAQQIVVDLQAKGAVPAELTVQAVGPYVNFTAPRQKLLGALLPDILAGDDAGRYGSLKADTRGTWVLEFSSPNVAKPLNIYHLRPTALGAALDRIGRYRGYKVVSINHLGDWGKQYGMLSVAVKKYGSQLPASPTNLDLVDLYVKINADAEKDPQIQVQAREAFLKLEQGDPEVTALWKRCVDISLKEFHRMYERLGVKFDHVWGESFYKDELAGLTDGLKKSGILVESEGAWVIPVTDRNGKEIPPCIVQKSDGATIYATRDLAAAIYRQKKFNFDRMTYIVGQEQKLHFEQVFGALRKMGKDWESRCEHVPFGLYRFKDAKMSTRKGNFVTLESVIEEAKTRVTELMKARGTTEPTEAIVEAIAIGAVVFHDLHTDPARDVEFDLDRVVDFEGETGPYLQYAHTRCLSILRKAQEAGAASGRITFQKDAAELLTHDLEIQLVKTLGQFPLQLERTLSFAKASQLAHYLIDVTQAFGAFYRECHVLGEDAKLTQGRLMLVEATRRILAQGAALLGIPLPEKM